MPGSWAYSEEVYFNPTQSIAPKANTDADLQWQLDTVQQLVF